MLSTIPQKTFRSLQSLRTTSGKVDNLTQPHMAYMRVSVLEMEKARRLKERESCAKRVSEIDNRIKEIDAEKMQIERILEMKKAENQILPEQPKSSSGAFRIRY